MSLFRLPAGTRIGRVHLRVADLERSLGFYRELLGFRVLCEGLDSLSLSATGEPPELILLSERRGARPKPPRTTGLYHFAILLPARRDLARALLRLDQAQWPRHGFADHAVSEAVYLQDPDGNGVEIYADRPREQWRRQNGEILMTTVPLDLDDLLREAGDPPEPWAGAPPGTTIGHVHLRVSDLEAAERFYEETLGFDVVARYYPGARFLSAGGYHHHVAVNVWAGPGAGRPPEDAAGLVDFEILVPGQTAVDRVLDRLRERGVEPVGLDGAWRVEDPDGIGIVLRSEPEEREQPTGR